MIRERRVIVAGGISGASVGGLGKNADAAHEHPAGGSRRLINGEELINGEDFATLLPRTMGWT